MTLADTLIAIAGILWAIELIPQLIKTIKTKRVKDISIIFLSLCFIAYIFFLIGCYLKKEWVLLFSHMLPWINLIILLGFTIKYSRRK